MMIIVDQIQYNYLAYTRSLHKKKMIKCLKLDANNCGRGNMQKNYTLKKLFLVLFFKCDSNVITWQNLL